jgi:glycosyltransferase involved in cell wall biosynthesis
VPVYNVEDYVAKCIESITNQTYGNLEIILIDDGSTDKSGDICDEYSKKDNRVIVVHQENQGLSMARNNALDIAGGDYIGFVDSDDWISPDMYYILYSNIIEYDADMAICNFHFVDQNGDVVLDSEGKYIYEKNAAVVKAVLQNDDKMAHYFHFDTYDVVAWNKLYDKKLFDGIRYPCGKIFEDTFTTHKLIDKADKIVVLPEYEYFYLCRDDSITKKPFSLNHFDRIEACVDRYDYIAIKYPNLENVCRKYIFYSLLSCINKALRDDVVAKYKIEIDTVINQVRKHSTHDCGLLQNEETMLKLLFDDIRKYITGIRIYSKNGGY